MARERRFRHDGNVVFLPQMAQIKGLYHPWWYRPFCIHLVHAEQQGSIAIIDEDPIGKRYLFRHKDLG
jgi:hypothetical protein